MVTFDNVRSLIFELNDTAMAIRTGKTLRGAVDGDRLLFTPESTGFARESTIRIEFEAIVSAVAQTGDRRTSAYRQVSGNSPYILALIERCEAES